MGVLRDHHLFRTSKSDETTSLALIDMIQVIRRDHLQPDHLIVSFGYTTDHFVLGVPLGSPKTSYVLSGSHVARVWECASSWAGAEVRAKVSWRATRSDRGEP
ncbi:hypothetical protein E5676_scaffold208G00110 [Cucumis melo var. makuwa]|uniref:Uncharacterized protein n=1 Tax=Cucumis melo var. makuwa TaxID=1194695 RepID=A0A5D3E1Q4_CUCMM|nr:hypothetical protein E5676_scaffold208G00110 [Cucumis melo var. makuwa]